MAICNIIDDPARTREQFEQISAHVQSSGPVPPDGCLLVLIGTERAPLSGYRSRLRRYVYLHQDVLWVGLVAAVAAGILIRLLSA